MRVAFDVGGVHPRPTGVGVFGASMANALAEALSPNELVLIGKRAGSNSLPDWPRTTTLRGRYLVWLQTRAWRDITRSGADIGHFSDGLVPFRRAGRTAVSIHDMSVVRQWRTHPARRLLRVPFALIAPRLADLVIVPSRATADEVMRLTGCSARKIEVMPYAPGHRIGPADDATIASAMARHGLAKYGYVLALGTIEPRKNHARLVEAFEVLATANQIPTSIELVIAGSAGWHAQPILERVKSSPVASRIRHLGYVPAADLPSLLSAAAVVAYPSLYEGFGLPVVEALACGAPTVTSNLSSMPEVAGPAGFLVDPFDPGDIARGILDALRAADGNREAVAAAAIAQAGTFSWQRAARTAIDLYRTRLGG